MFDDSLDNKGNNKNDQNSSFFRSSRAASYNQKLVNIAAQGAQTAGADVTVINLADFPMPIFCEDYEAEHGMPESAQQLKALIQSHDGLLIASPEYNSSYTALLKNSIDWVTRPGPTDALKGNPLSGKAASIMVRFGRCPRRLSWFSGVENAAGESWRDCSSQPTSARENS